MTATERKAALAERPEENRRQILAKIQEYEVMSPSQQELRLQATELRWYLWPLMHMPATNRAALLVQVPLACRALVADRLQEWDILPPDCQQELLENDATIRYFTDLQSRGVAGKPNDPAISPARREQLEAGLERWQALPEARRRAMLAQFQRFFELTPREKRRALTMLSDVECQEIQKTLVAFGNLSPDDRARCVRSFEKFLNLTVEERRRFLKNAELWKALSPEERQQWRDLVSKLHEAPPLPPNADAPPIPSGKPTRSDIGKPPATVTAGK